MNRAIVLLAACGAKAAPVVAPSHEAPATDAITLRFAHQPVGTRWHDTYQVAFDYAQPADKRTSLVDKTIELTAVEGDRVTAERVRYDMERVVATVDGQNRETRAAIDGQTYRVEIASGVEIVLHDDGSGVSSDEARFVLADIRLGDEQGPFEQFVDGRRFVEGEPVAVPATALINLIRDPGAKATITFRGMHGGDARFDYSEQIATGDQAATIAGTLSVDLASGVEHTIDLSGDVRSNGATVAHVSIHGELTRLPRAR